MADLRFPLRADSSPVTIEDLRGFDELAAYRVFCLIRWPDSDGRPICVRCTHVNCWEIRRRCFKCRACRREFSATAGTVFAFRKMTFQDILAAMWFSANGKNPLWLSRELSCQYKSAWALMKKMRSVPIENSADTCRARL